MTSQLITLLLSQFIAYVISNFIVVPSYYLAESQTNLTNRYYRSITKAVIFFVFSFLLSIRANFVVSSILLALIVGVVNLFFDKKEKANSESPHCPSHSINQFIHCRSFA